MDARQQEIRGVREKYAVLDRKAAELFGGKVKTWGDLIRLAARLPKGSVSFWNGGEMQEKELTQGNLMYAAGWRRSLLRSSRRASARCGRS